MRFITLLATSFGVILCHVVTSGASSVEEQGNHLEEQRGLQDQAVCDQLKTLLEANTTAMDIQNSCQCTLAAGGDTSLICAENNICIMSDGGLPFQGDFSATFTQASTGTSYTQNITTEICFQYPSDLYDGQKVCVTNFRDGLGIAAACLIQVGSDFCSVCRYCPVNLISFDCSNLGYEDRTACAANSTNDSILQFLYLPSMATGCTGGSSAAPSTFPPTASPRGGVVSLNTILSIVASLVPLFLMG